MEERNEIYSDLMNQYIKETGKPIQNGYDGTIMPDYVFWLETKAAAYDRLMSGGKDTKGWINIEHEPKYTGYYMVIANVASEFGGYKGVVPAHYNTLANHWLFAFDLIGSVIAYKPFPKMPDGWEES